MPEPITFKAFFERMLRENPFLDNRINDPAQLRVDVAAIHRNAFDRLTSLAEQALQARCGLGAVLWGEAGIGKSHLLARLSRWAAERPAHLVYLHNLQASPDGLPRALLHAIIASLTLGRRAGLQATPLYALVKASVIESAGEAGQFEWGHLARLYARWFDGLGMQSSDRLIFDVLFRFFHSASRASLGSEDGQVAALAVRWLGGGALDPDEARLLRLPPGAHRDDPVALVDAQQIKQVVVALARLAVSHERPFILALDQVDNLDVEQFAALARFLQAVVDAAPGLLVITSGVQSTLMQWRQGNVAQESTWDRLAQFEVRLQRLTAAGAEALVLGRLEAFLGPFTVLSEVARQRDADPLFPLGEDWAETHLRDRIDSRPRDIISLARDRWQHEQCLAQIGPASWLAGWPLGESTRSSEPRELSPEELLNEIDSTVETEMATFIERLHALPGSLVTDADHIAGLLHELLAQCCEDGADESGPIEIVRLPPRKTGLPTYHLSLTRLTPAGPVVTGVLVLSTGAATSVAGFLRRLCENERPLDRLAIVTNDREGMPLGVKGQEYLDQLKERGPGRFVEVKMTIAELAMLEALLGVVQRARSGDVEIDLGAGQARPVSAAEVIASHRQQGRYEGHRLLAELLRVPERPAVVGRMPALPG